MDTTLTAPPSGTRPGTSSPAPVTQTPPPGHPAGNGEDNKSLHQKSRGKIPWSQEVWKRIDEAVQHEMKRARVGARFLPLRSVPPKTTSVPSDQYLIGPPPAVLNVDEGATLRLNEYYVEFELTPQQVDQEMGDIKQLGHSTAVTLATRAANILAEAEDLIVFQGQNAVLNAAPFTTNLVLMQGTLADSGLLNFPIAAGPPAMPIGAGPLAAAVSALLHVAPLAPAVPGVIYGEHTFEAVTAGISQLQAAGHYGPYALVLQTVPYADTFAPLPGTLILTADRLKPLLSAGFFGSGALPPNAPAAAPAPRAAAPRQLNPPYPVGNAPYFGVLVSLGGNTMDLVMGLEPIAAFMQEDTGGSFRFRVLERFALRVKDPTGIIVFQFD